MKILVIADSSPTIRKAARIALDACDFQVEEITCRADLEEYLSNHSFDFLLFGFSNQFDSNSRSDLSLEALQKTLLLYSEKDNLEKEDWLKLGFLHVLQKPFSAQQLMDATLQMSSSHEPLIKMPNDENLGASAPEVPIHVTDIFDEQEKILNERSQKASLRSGGSLLQEDDLALNQDLTQASENVALSEGMKAFLRQQIKEFCRQEFPLLAKEVLSEELQKLSNKAQERFVDSSKV
ncbi:MAG: hypothetical protein AB8C84_05430 [Oligoflexales bacterium]